MIDEKLLLALSSLSSRLKVESISWSCMHLPWPVNTNRSIIDQNSSDVGASISITSTSSSSLLLMLLRSLAYYCPLCKIHKSK